MGVNHCSLLYYLDLTEIETLHFVFLDENTIVAV